MPSRSPVPHGRREPLFRPPHASSRFGVLDGYRAFAAFSVLVYHVAASTGLVYGTGLGARSLGGLGHLGVAIFFVLSGFLLFRPYVVAHLSGTPPRPWRRYLRHRVLRIVPAYWVALTGLLILLPNSTALKIAGRPPSPYDYLSFYTLTVNFRPGFVFKGLAVAWTLHIELAFYLVLPMIAWAIAHTSRRIGGSVRTRLLTTLGGLALLACVSLTYRTMVVSWWDGPTDPHSLWLLNYFDWFAVGMVLATLVAWSSRGGSLPRVIRVATSSPTAGWMVACGLYVIAIYVTRRTGVTTPETMAQAHLRFALFGAIGLVLLAPVTIGTRTRDPARQLLSASPILYFGMISYGVYLWHVVIRNVLVDSSWWKQSSKGFWILFVPTFLATVLIASLSYYAVEKPLLRLKDPLPPRAGSKSPRRNPPAHRRDAPSGRPPRSSSPPKGGEAV